MPSLAQGSKPKAMPGPKRGRPPKLVGLDTTPVARNIAIELESPLDIRNDDEEEEETLQLDSSPSSTSSSSPVGLPASLQTDTSVGTDVSDQNSDDLSKDFAVLERLRTNIKQNLRLRPIKSSPSLPKVKTSARTPPVGNGWSDVTTDDMPSPASSTTSDIFYTPISEFRSPPATAHFLGGQGGPSSFFDSPPPVPAGRVPHGLEPSALFDRLSASSRPLLIDTRPPASYSASHIQDSINVAIPSLILKRCRKPGGGFHTLDALRQFVTTDQGKQSWDELMKPDGKWDGDVVVLDDEMDEKSKDGTQVASWALLRVLPPLLSFGHVDYLKGGVRAAREDHHLRKYVVSVDVDPDRPRDERPGSGKGRGLFQLDTNAAAKSKLFPEIDHPPAQRSPLPLMPGAMHSATFADSMDSMPSPPPSQVGFRRPPPPRRPSIPNLGRLDTKSAERLNGNLPKLQVRVPPVKSATLAVPPSGVQPGSPGHLNLTFSSHSPPGSAARFTTSPETTEPSDFFAPPSPAFMHSRSSSPRTPGTPMAFPPTPKTARPEDAPPTTEEPFPVFTISTILPHFLYLGPEPSQPEHVQELLDLGVRRILNIAVECDDDQGLQLRQKFERYVRIPMRDTVEEDNITRGVREACEILDDARLHSAPTYVHCKAGKSRSVTAVMAYLIHANHWTLSRAYAFVLDRRKGISPNIGFVSELMTFEEQELGSKSIGVVKGGGPSDSADASDSNGDAGGRTGNYAVVANGRARAHVRDSLPPAFTTGGERVELFMAGAGEPARVGDSGQEVEIKDASGRYRHARRAPVDETTLQPLRRVSKAGLESSAYA